MTDYMNDVPRQKLRELIAQHGRSLSQDARRCKGLLSDYCAPYRREVAVLTMAVEEHVAADLLTAPSNTPRAALRARLARRLCDNLALSEDAARWAVVSWALALGQMSEAELSEAELSENEPLEAIAPAIASQARRASTSPAPPTSKATPAAPLPAPAQSQSPAALIVSAQGGGHYASITEAISAAAPGARILIRPGRYEENLVLNQQIALLGDGPAEQIIIASDSGSCLQVRASQATVSGLTLLGRAASTGTAFFAVEITQGKLLLDNCAVNSDTLSCVGLHGAASKILLRRCRIYDGADSGVYLFDGAQGTLEECEIYGHANVGVAVTGGAQVAIKRSRIHDGRNAGIVAWQQGAGLIEESEIFGNHLAGIGISEGGNLTVRDCRIYGGENSGVYVHDGGEGALEHCDIFEHRMAEVAVTTRGNLAIHDSQLHDGQHCGLFLSEEGQALVQESGIHGNSLSGVLVGAGASAALHHCQINDNREVGVKVAADGAVNVEDSDLTNNYLGPWDVADGAVIESERNRE